MSMYTFILLLLNLLGNNNNFQFLQKIMIFNKSRLFLLGPQPSTKTNKSMVELIHWHSIRIEYFIKNFYNDIYVICLNKNAGISSSTKFTLVNQCIYTVWPATLSNAGTPGLPGSATGFSLAPGSTNIISVPGSWSGRMWARTHCNGGSTSGNFSCATGDCATGSVVCSGSGARPPATLVEFTLNGSDGLDFYDVSLVDGYNLPLMVRPVGGSGNLLPGRLIKKIDAS